MLIISRAIDFVNTMIARVVIWLTLVMIFVAFGNATLRYTGRAIGENLTWTASLDLQWYLYSIVFLGLGGYTMLRDSNVRVDVIYSRVNDRKKCVLDLIGLVLFIIPFALLIMYVSWPFVANSLTVFERSPDPGGLPRWVIKPLIPLAFLLILLQAVSQIIKSVAFLAGKGPSPYPTSGI